MHCLVVCLFTLKVWCSSLVSSVVHPISTSRFLSFVVRFFVFLVGVFLRIPIFFFVPIQKAPPPPRRICSPIWSVRNEAANKQKVQTISFPFPLYSISFPHPSSKGYCSTATKERRRKKKKKRRRPSLTGLTPLFLCPWFSENLLVLPLGPAVAAFSIGGPSSKTPSVRLGMAFEDVLPLRTTRSGEDDGGIEMGSVIVVVVGAEGEDEDPNCWCRV